MGLMRVLQVVSLFILAYLLGSIPSAVWFGGWLRGVDVREYGSHNAGTTNTMRVLGWRIGLLVLLVDVSKGFFAVRLVEFLPSAYPYSAMWVAVLLGILATLGHMFPLFVGFRGGKGVATLCGVALALHPGAALVSLIVFTVVLLLTRYVSLGSILGGLAFPLSLVFLFNQVGSPLISFGGLVSLLLLVSHRQNVYRLLHGCENRFVLSRSGSYQATDEEEVIKEPEKKESGGW